MKPWTLLAWGGLCLLLGVPRSAAGAKPDPEPFLVPADSVDGRHHRIALSFVYAEGNSRVPTEDAITDFAARMGQRLTAAGYSVIPADSALQQWRAAVRSQGGLFDPRTGRRDTSRVRAISERMYQALRDSLGADLWLQYEVIEVLAEYDAGTAKWDGVKRDVGAPGLIAALVLGYEEGQVPALSLRVSVTDIAGHPLYSRRAGLVSRHHMVKNHWIDVPLESLREETVSEPAVSRALGPWLDRVKPESPESRKL